MATKTVPCNYCLATGKVSSGYGGYAKTACPVCCGRGRISIDENAKKCSGCNGSGRQYTGYHTLGMIKHSTCRGTGWTVPPNKQTAYIVACSGNMR
jgi:hypothetical protein